ncbi:D-alanine--D-alanine ligase [Frankia sp. AiPs1]|uniref:D-alanine--D-alanine ligase family protein n=1 Tax=Frankia sp. AiPa1 TaxID=573492 RepID=UPI00202B1F48|nr:D-alanine--D-alanine ligase family protein [Frankia sp. AiPa1]MCL9762558.1 D-alanine--D-alanine ligase [Frankia sp. AiPa1]
MPGTPGRIRLALLFGGRSTEHAISCVSAGGVLRALDHAVYDVVPIGIDPDGRWILLPADAEVLRASSDQLPTVRAAAGRQIVFAADPTARRLILRDSADLPPGSPADAPPAAAPPADIDVVFPILHGPFGEDGTVQGLFEMAGVPYVGSGVFASAAAMDKEHMKAQLAAAGLPIGPYAVLRTGESLSEADQRRLGLPVFVKPARGGSSIGISRVDAWNDLETAVKAARTHDPKVLVEAGIVGREIECGVLGRLDGPGAQASLPAEITVDSAAGFYDFDAKYVSTRTRFDVPAVLSPQALDRIRSVAVRAFTALDCAGLARVDVFLTPDEQVVVNEVNTMPGFTPTSMFPRMWAASGLDFSALVDRLIRLALRDGAGLR